MEGLVRLLRGYQSGGMPGFVNYLGTDPLGGEIGADTAAVLLGLKLGSPFILESLVDNAHMWESSSNQLGWLDPDVTLFYSLLI